MAPIKVLRKDPYPMGLPQMLTATHISNFPSPEASRPQRRSAELRYLRVVLSKEALWEGKDTRACSFNRSSYWD